MNKYIESLKKQVCCPDSEHHDDYCCMKQKGYNEALNDILKYLKNERK